LTLRRSTGRAAHHHGGVVGVRDVVAAIQHGALIFEAMVSRRG
jgi:hypothetical protein